MRFTLQHVVCRCAGACILCAVPHGQQSAAATGGCAAAACARALRPCDTGLPTHAAAGAHLYCDIINGLQLLSTCGHV